MATIEIGKKDQTQVNDKSTTASQDEKPKNFLLKCKYEILSGR
jgi:hypothetical protein